MFGKVRLAFPLSLLFIFLPSLSHSVTLTDFISSVQTANPSLETLRHQAKALELRAEASGYWQDPFFGVGLDEVPENNSAGGMVQYQLSQTIPFPGRLSARKAVAQSQAKLATSEVRSAERELVVISAQLYARAFYTQKAMATNREQRFLLAELLGSSRVRYKSGTGDHHELILAKLEIASLDADYLRLGRELKVLKSKMNELKSSPIESPVELESVSIEENFPRSFEEAVQDQPELLAARAGVEAARAEAQSARLSYFPDFVLQAMYMTPRSMNEDPMTGGMEEVPQWGVMVGFSLPLFFFGKQAGLSSAAQVDREARVANQRSVENRLRTEWVEAKAQLATAEDLVKLFKSEVIPNTELAASTGRSAYVARRLRLSQFVDILRIQRTLSLEQTAAEIDVAMAKLRLIYLLSQPPLLRLAPMRPTLFGSGSMGEMGTPDSGAVNMGSGMRTPSLRQESRPEKNGSGDGMEGM